MSFLILQHVFSLERIHLEVLQFRIQLRVKFGLAQCQSKAGFSLEYLFAKFQSRIKPQLMLLESFVQTEILILNLER